MTCDLVSLTVVGLSDEEEEMQTAERKTGTSEEEGERL